MARIYRKGRDGIWFAYWFEQDGTRTTRSTRTRRKRDAQRVGDELERAARAAAHHASGRKASLGEALVALIKSLEAGGKAPATIRNTSIKAAHLRSYFGDDAQLSAFEPPGGITRLAGYVSHRLAQKAARSTIAIEVSVLKMALGVAARDGRFRGDTRALSVRELRGAHKPRRQWLTVEGAQRVIAETPPQWRDHVEIYVGLGVRRMELYRITAADLDLAGNRVHVRGTKTERADRWVPMTVRVREILERRAASRPDRPLFSQWTRAHLDLAPICERAKVPYTTVSDLRRTFASLMLSAGVSSSVLKEFLGHATTRQIDLVYGHASEDAKQGAAMRHPLSGSQAVAAPLLPPTTGGTKGTGKRRKKRRKR